MICPGNRDTYELFAGIHRMTLHPKYSTCPLLLLLCLAPALAQTPATRPATRPAPATRPVPPKQEVLAPPKTAKELLAIEQKLQAALERTMAATVGVRVGGGQGSGVILADGYVLTAAHVISEPNRDCTLILPSGKSIKGKTLGLNRDIDSGLIKITEPGEYAHVELGASAPLKIGQWCFALGHPNGYRRDRPPVLRLGRVLSANSAVVMTDCTLVGGDSGGPLFDLDGKVIGIHSRIGNSTLANMHVPADTFRETWDRLKSAEAWGGLRMPAMRTGPVLGVRGADAPNQGGALIEGVFPKYPAAKAGLKAGDIVVRFDGKEVKSLDALVKLVDAKKPNDKVDIEILRDGKKMTVQATLVAP